MGGLEKLYQEAFKLLKGQYEAIIAVVIVASAVGLYFLKAPLAFAFGLPVAIYLLYIFRMDRSDGHKERLAETNVKRIEATKGVPAKTRMRKAIERRRKDDGTD